MSTAIPSRPASRPHAFSRALLARDETFADLSGVARRIHGLRGRHGVQLAACTLGWRGSRAPVAAVEVNALDDDANPVTLIGYAIVAGEAGHRAVDALRRALERGQSSHLVADPDAGREAAVLS